MQTETEKIIPVPDLKINKILYPPHGIPHHGRRLEQAIVWALFLHLEKIGFTPSSVNDGECITGVATKLEATELIFNLDEADIYFKKGSLPKHWVKLVLGNEMDVVSDYSYSTVGEDGFRTAMEAFDPERAVVIGVRND